VTLYAAYGSNLDPRRMAERAPASPVFGTGWLRGWRLTFAGEELGWGGSMCTVVEDDRESVFVMLYDVPPLDEQALDVWEDIDLGMWRKVRVRVHTLDGEPLAWIYVLDAYEGGLPTSEHVTMIANAAERAGAPVDYVAHLMATPCQDLPDG
jgi:gamma-glutamylcyclotransferase (GGCT)/AIG2-like uncharacterized protein YtfP